MYIIFSDIIKFCKEDNENKIPKNKFNKLGIAINFFKNIK